MNSWIFYPKNPKNPLFCWFHPICLSPRSKSSRPLSSLLFPLPPTVISCPPPTGLSSSYFVSLCSSCCVILRSSSSYVALCSSCCVILQLLMPLAALSSLPVATSSYYIILSSSCCCSMFLLLCCSLAFVASSYCCIVLLLLCRISGVAAFSCCVIFSYYCPHFLLSCPPFCYLLVHF